MASVARVCAVVVLLLCVVAPGNAEEESIDARIQQAYDADGTDGIEALLRALADPDERLATRRVLGTMYLQTDPYRSLTHFEALADAGEPSDQVTFATALVAVAKHNLATGNARASGVVTYLMDARRILDEAALPADDAGLLARAALTRAESHYYEGQLDLTATALAGVTDFPDGIRQAGFGLLAQVHYRQADYRAAAEAFEQAGQVRGAAAAWAAAKDGERAGAAYAQLIRADPADRVLLEDAVAAVRYGGGVSALDEALSSLEAEGAVRAAHLVARADLAAILGAGASAKPLLQEAARLDETRSDALLRLARLSLTQAEGTPDARRAAATDVLLEALSRTPDHPQVVGALWHVAGRDYRDLWKTAGQGPGLERTLRIQLALVRAAPDDATAWANLGNTYRVGGDVESALAAYRKAREQNEWDPGIVSDLGLALSSAGEDAQALEAYLESVVLDEGHLAGRQNAGRALWRLGRDDEAESQLATALQKARAVERKPMTYRFLLDRIFRTRQDEDLR